MDENRPPMNGGELLAMRKLREGDYVVLVKMDTLHGVEFVTARAAHYTDPTWFLGHYLLDIDEATHDFMKRAYYS